MAKYRKKPVEVEALLWSGGEYSCINLFCGKNWTRADVRDVDWCGIDDSEQIVIFNTAQQQWLCVPVGWWIVRGIHGELYPVKPDIFATTYEAVDV